MKFLFICPCFVVFSTTSGLDKCVKKIKSWHLHSFKGNGKYGYMTIQIRTIQIRKIQIPTTQIPTIQIPTIQIPTIQIPTTQISVADHF